MTTIYVDALAWDALDPDAQQAAVESAQVPVVLGIPARQHGTFAPTGEFVPAEAGPEWCLWDDGRLTDEHAIALMGAIS